MHTFERKIRVDLGNRPPRLRGFVALPGQPLRGDGGDIDKMVVEVTGERLVDDAQARAGCWKD